MKKIGFVIILILLAMGLPARGQSSADVVKAVRAAYAEAKEKISRADGESAPRNDATATIRYNVPGTGPRTAVVHCYFDLDTDADGAHYRPYFITLKYNIAAREFYEEYLFDPDSGRLKFAFLQGDNFSDVKNEERYYYDDAGKLVSENIKGERLVENAALLAQAEKYRSLIPQSLDFTY